MGEGVQFAGVSQSECTHQDAGLRRARPRHGRVKEHCILRGLAWEGTLAATACSEQEYYEDLLAFYRQIYRARSCAPSWAGGSGSSSKWQCACAGSWGMHLLLYCFRSVCSCSALAPCETSSTRVKTPPVYFTVRSMLRCPYRYA